MLRVQAGAASLPVASPLSQAKGPVEPDDASATPPADLPAGGDTSGLVF